MNTQLFIGHARREDMSTRRRTLEHDVEFVGVLGHDFEMSVGEHVAQLAVFRAPDSVTDDEAAAC